MFFQQCNFRINLHILFLLRNFSEATSFIDCHLLTIDFLNFEMNNFHSSYFYYYKTFVQLFTYFFFYFHSCLHHFVLIALLLLLNSFIFIKIINFLAAFLINAITFIFVILSLLTLCLQ